MCLKAFLKTDFCSGFNIEKSNCWSDTRGLSSELGDSLASAYVSRVTWSRAISASLA